MVTALFTSVAVATEPSVENVGVYELTQQGWQIIARADRRELRAGEAPYEALTRVVLVSEYQLQKGEEKIICTLVYDSQKDAQTEACQKQ